MTRSGASPNTIICRLCESELRWHLKPFSSRHCLPHIWQYHRSFCRPLDLMRFPICRGHQDERYSWYAHGSPSTKQSMQPGSTICGGRTALGLRKSFLPILVRCAAPGRSQVSWAPVAKLLMCLPFYCCMSNRLYEQQACSQDIRAEVLNTRLVLL